MRLARLSPLLFALALTGCVSMGSPADMSPVNLETARFETTALSPAVVEAVQALVPQFASRPGLVDVGGGRIETEYVSLRSIQEAQESAEVPGGPILSGTLLRYTVQTTPIPRRNRTLVTITATMRPTGAAYLPQRTPARYWLDRFTQDLATATGAAYKPTVSDEAYLAAIDRGGDVRPPQAPGATNLSKPLRTVGLVALGLIAASIIVTASN